MNTAAAVPTQPRRRRFWDVFAALGRPRVALMLAMGISSGLPFMLIGNTLGAWLKADGVGNAAIGYSVSSSSTHPGIRAAYWSLPNKTAPTEITIMNGTGDEENSSLWGNLTSMTVDPTDNCTFWYLNRYYAASQTGTTIDWDTRIGYFKITGCH